MKILCTTDFSKHSIDALHVALQLANDLKSELHIISVYQVEKRAATLVSMDEIIRKNNEEDMANLISGLGQMIENDNLPISRVIRGDTVNTILKYAERLEMDLIVMGTQGSNNLKSARFGSVTKKVTSRSKVPILAVPKDYKYDFADKRVVIALDEKPIPLTSAFSVLKRIAAHFNTSVDILHVQPSKEGSFFDEAIHKTLGDICGTTTLQVHDDPIIAIKDYCKESNTGLLVMIKRSKSFFKKLFIVANTSEGIGLTKIPLLIIPE